MRNDEQARERALEAALDKALARYASVEPLAGLEQRVLHRVRAAGAGRSYRFGRWTIAAGVAAAALLIAVLWKSQVPPGVHRASLARAVAYPERPQIGPRPAPRAMKRHRAAAGLPKRRVFPTPAPVSREESAFLALAGAPDQVRAWLDLERRNSKPIQVEEIRIEPLRSDDANDNRQ